jgi:nucleolar protein 56
VEERLAFYDKGAAPTKNIVAMQAAMVSAGMTPGGGEKKSKKRSKEAGEDAGEEKKAKKSKKDKKDKGEKKEKRAAVEIDDDDE